MILVIRRIREWGREQGAGSRGQGAGEAGEAGTRETREKYLPQYPMPNAPYAKIP
ncbi:MAG: hypothetical protein ACRAVC_04830 [Trichormus sp.]